MNGACNDKLFLPHPMGSWGWAKKSNIIKFQLIQFQRFFEPNFVCLLTNERYITYQTGFSCGRLGHALGWVGLWGTGDGVIFFLQNSTKFGV